MSPVVVGAIGLAILFVVIFCGVSIGIGMALVGFLGCVYLVGMDIALSVMRLVPYRTTASYSLSVVPLFVVMGELTYHSGLSRDLYYAVYRWLGRLPGGLAMATVGGCAGFAAICGSSTATAATMGTVALPEMKRYGYDDSLATGCVAAGGTLGVLIPPSVIFIIYGFLTEQCIGRLFIAGVLPGVLLVMLFLLAIYVLVRHNPRLVGTAAPVLSFRDMLLAFKDVWAIMALFVLVIGGIYMGLFTPTEAGGVGAFGALVIALGRRRLTWRGFTSAVLSTGRTTGMIFLILIGAMIFCQFLTLSRLPFALASFTGGLPLPPHASLAFILLIFIFLGCVMDALSMILIMVPILFPVMMGLGFDPIWFGVIIVLISEMGAITPPVGINVYVIAGVAKNVSMFSIFRGILPFFVMMVLCLVLMIFFPQIALFLPGLM